MSDMKRPKQGLHLVKTKKMQRTRKFHFSRVRQPYRKK